MPSLDSRLSSADGTRHSANLFDGVVESCLQAFVDVSDPCLVSATSCLESEERLDGTFALPFVGKC